MHDLPGDVSVDREQALAQWMPALYSELRKLAAHYLRQERSSHTLQATALVHEAYLRLVGQRVESWQSRDQFMGVAAQLMRRILGDYSRGQHAEKRGGGCTKVYLHEASVLPPKHSSDVAVLDTALTKLAEFDPEQARMVELRFFGGLTIEETAAVMGTSPATIKRQWSVAKAWLARELRATKKPDA